MRVVTIDEMLVAARERIIRTTPAETQSELEAGAIVIDLRCDSDRSAGVIPGSIPIVRSVLEWRCDPTSEWSEPRVARPEGRVVLVCQDGFSSSLAADSLRQLGFERVGDLIGGMRAWQAAGLPVVPPGDH